MRKRICVLAVCAALLLSGCGENVVSEEESMAENVVSEEKSMAENFDRQILISYENRVLTHDAKFEGFGTALCWWANRIGYSDTLSQKAAKLFYGDDGLRFNIMRYNIGGGDDPEHHHVKRTDSEVPGWLYIGDDGEKYYDYTADERQLNVLSRCYELANKPYLEVFSNSAPYFMTESGCTGGAVISSMNNLKPECYEEFAEYLATVSEYINNDLLMTVNSISPMNEPDTNYWGAMSEKQEGCHTDPGEAQSAVIVATSKAFDAHGLEKVEVVASDETSTIKAVNSYKLYTEEAKACLDRVSTHTYDTTGIKTLGALREAEGFNLWMSEVDGGSSFDKNAGEMGSALYIADKIITDINDLKPSAWVMWQAIDNHISKDGFNGNKDSGMVNLEDGFWGLAVADHDKEEIILTQKYYGMGQFTRYIRPDSTLVLSDSNDVLCAYDEESGSFTIVAMNRLGEEKVFNFNIEGFDLSGKVSVIRTSGTMKDGEHWAEVDEFAYEGWDGNYTLKPFSVTTLVITK